MTIKWILHFNCYSMCHCVTLVWNPPSTFEITPQVKSPLKSKFSPNAPSTPILALFSSEYLKITIKWILHFNCYSVYLQNYQFPPITELETLTVTTNSFHSVTWCCLRFTWTTKHAIRLLMHGYTGLRVKVIYSIHQSKSIACLVKLYFLRFSGIFTVGHEENAETRAIYQLPTRISWRWRGGSHLGISQIFRHNINERSAALGSLINLI